MKFDLRFNCLIVSLIIISLFYCRSSVSADIVSAPCATSNITMNKSPDLSTIIVKPGQAAIFTNFSVTNNDTANCLARNTIIATVNSLPAGWTAEWMDSAGNFVANPINNINLGPGQKKDFAGIRITHPAGTAFGNYNNININIKDGGVGPSTLVNVKISDNFELDTSLFPSNISIPSDGTGWYSIIVYGLDEMTTLNTNDVTPVTFSLSPLPVGVNAVFSPYSNSPAVCIPLATGPLATGLIKGCARKLVITTTGATVGVYSITATITNSPVLPVLISYNTKTITFNLNVIANYPTCGNTVRENAYGEFCDYSAPAGSTGCTPPKVCKSDCSDCALPNCGNGASDVGEACDYSVPLSCGSKVCNATCNACVDIICGNGKVDISDGEICDFSAPLTLTGCAGALVCNISCTSCIAIPCGNGAVDLSLGEACDFSATSPGCALGETCNGSCTACIGGVCNPKTCNPPNQYCFDGTWIDCAGGATCTGAGVCGVSSYTTIFGNLGSVSSVKELFSVITDWFLTIVSALAILFLIIGGIIYLTAAGEEDRINLGKRIITYTIFGLVIILISYAIIVTINNIIS